RVPGLRRAAARGRPAWLLKQPARGTRGGSPNTRMVGRGDVDGGVSGVRVRVEPGRDGVRVRTAGGRVAAVPRVRSVHLGVPRAEADWEEGPPRRSTFHHETGPPRRLNHPTSPHETR